MSDASFEPVFHRYHATLEANPLIEVLLDAMPDLDLTPRDYEQLINAYTLSDLEMLNKPIIAAAITVKKRK